MLTKILECRRTAGLILAAMLSVFYAVPASAQNEHLRMRTGNDALTTCTSNFENEILAPSICLAWMKGVRDGHYLTMAFAKYERPVWCTPSNVTNQQFRDIFVKFLQDNPGRRHELPAALYVEALIEAFPCAEPNSRE